MKPKILLKPDHHTQNPSPASSQPVYIASQEFLNRSVAVNPAPKPHTSVESLPSEKHMKSCVDLLHSSFHGINSDLSGHLRENPFFRVIAVLGRGAQKVAVLNHLMDQNPDIFPVDSKGMQMFITKDRQIILNVDLNSCRKVGREGAVEQLMLFLSLLKTCHTIVFIEPEMEARHCVRLLRCAEVMDSGYDKLGLNPEFLPQIIFMAGEWSRTTCSMVECLFKGSRLQAHVIGRCSQSSDVGVMFQNLFKVAYRPPRATMSLQTSSAFTELHWYQILESLWKLHKTNYFLVKYVKGSSVN